MNILNNESNKKDFLEMCKYEGKTFVIKYGGSIMSNDVAKEAFVDDIELMTKAGIKVVIVHGGGPLISKWVKKTGGENKFVKGLRVTSKDTMVIVEMVLSGYVNKRLSMKRDYFRADPNCGRIGIHTHKFKGLCI